jgi:hypothetical protein
MRRRHALVAWTRELAVKAMAARSRLKTKRKPSPLLGKSLNEPAQMVRTSREITSLPCFAAPLPFGDGKEDRRLVGIPAKTVLLISSFPPCLRLCASRSRAILDRDNDVGGRPGAADGEHRI